MRKSRRAVTIVAATTATALAGISVAIALPFASRGGGSADSLRALGSRVHLAVGTAVIPSELDGAQTAAIIADQFSSVTPGNDMKWEVVEPTRGTYDWSAADRLVAFAEAHGQQVRGHTLLWHNQLPNWLTSGVANGTISKAELKALLHKHVTDEVTHFKGKIWQWDVANEFFANGWDAHPLADGINGDDWWVQNLGEGVVAEAFRWAHAADPQALLFYNDFNGAGQDGTNAKFQSIYNWVQAQRNAGVPIDGVGEQGHLDTQYGFSPQRFTEDLQAFSELGVKVAVTEADVRTFVDSAATQVPTDSLGLFAQPYEFSAMPQACLATRNCISFTAWGFWDTNSWVPGWFKGEGYATLYDVNLHAKPVLFDLQRDLRLAAGAPRRRGTVEGEH